MNSLAKPWLIVGLGNPAVRYQSNRHNVGQMVLDVLAQRTNEKFSRHKAHAQVVETRLGVLPGGVPGPRVILAKPATFMNLSGGPVQALAKFYQIPAPQILVIHDELDLPPHKLRLKQGGGEGGHNGLRSISGAIGTRDYLRLRVGVGRPPGRQDPADYVISDFPKSDRVELGVTLERAADAVEAVVTLGLEKAQLQLHSAN